MSCLPVLYSSACHEGDYLIFLPGRVADGLNEEIAQCIDHISCCGFRQNHLDPASTSDQWVDSPGGHGLMGLYLAWSFLSRDCGDPTERRQCDSALRLSLFGLVRPCLDHVDLQRPHGRVPGHQRFVPVPEMLWGRMAAYDSAVDFFRSHPDRRPPLACFLSHIHSDHLAGLETLRSPL